MDVKDLHKENFKSINKEIEKDTEKGKDISVYGFKINIMKMTIPPKPIRGLMQYKSKYPQHYHRNRQSILTFT